MNRRHITLTLAIGALETLGVLVGLAGAISLALLLSSDTTASETTRIVWAALGAVLGMAATDGLIADLFLSPVAVRLRTARTALKAGSR